MDISKIATDKTLEASGAWIQYDDETSFLVASLRSKTYRAAFDREKADLARKFKKPSREQTEEALMRCYAESILLGWKGVVENGTEIPCTIDNRLRVLQTCPSVWDFIVNKANEYETFQREIVEEAKAALGEH